MANQSLKNNSNLSRGIIKTEKNQMIINEKVE